MALGNWQPYSRCQSSCMWNGFSSNVQKCSTEVKPILGSLVYLRSRVVRRRQWHPTPVLLPGKSHGQRSLVLQSLGLLWGGHDWAASLSLFTFIIGEGNGNPLQCSCLENPRDGGAWWVAVCGVAQSQTRLKRVSRGSSFCLHILQRKYTGFTCSAKIPWGVWFCA